MFPNFYDTYGYLVKDELDSYMIEQGFTFLGEGQARRTFLSKNKRYVLKFHKKNDCYHNQHEALVWRKWFNKPNPNRSNCIYAPCRLIDNNILMMRAMVEIYGGTDGCNAARAAGIGGSNTYDFQGRKALLPEDIQKWIADVAQYGKMANGKYAIYDYG